MAIVARLLPRCWDGRRLLQFLTGLALIALAFAVPALLDQGDHAEPPVTIVTTVDTPLPPGLPVTDAPERIRVGDGLAPEAEGTEPAETAAQGTDSAARSDGTAAPSADRAAQDDVLVDASVGQGAVPARGRICVAARAAVGGPTQRAHGERGPPQA